MQLKTNYYLSFERKDLHSANEINVSHNMLHHNSQDPERRMLNALDTAYRAVAVCVSFACVQGACDNKLPGGPASTPAALALVEGVFGQQAGRSVEACGRMMNYCCVWFLPRFPMETLGTQL